MTGRKGAAPLGALALFIAIIILISIMVINSRGCNSDSECPDNSYCGVDHDCHEHKIIEVSKNNLTAPSLILGAAIILAAFIAKKNKYS